MTLQETANKVNALKGAEVQIETHDGEIYMMLLGGLTAQGVFRAGKLLMMVWGYSLTTGKHMTCTVKDICEI